MSQSGLTKTSSGSGAVSSVTGVGNIVAAPTSGNVVVSSNGIQLYRGPTVDFTTAGTTLLFTTGSTAFVPLFVTTISISITGLVSASVFNMGWTAPDYSDFLMADTNTNFDNGQFSSIGFTSSPGVLIPAATNIYINVTTPAVATTDREAVYITGFYL